MEPITGARVWELLKQAEDLIPSVGRSIGKMDADELDEISTPLWEFICAARKTQSR